MSGCTRTPHPLHTDILVRRGGGGLVRWCERGESVKQREEGREREGGRERGGGREGGKR